jgi:hypothetical protein
VSALLEVLQAFYHDKLEALRHHEGGARLILQYDANNTYQYIVNRDEMHLSWLATAIESLGGAVEAGSPGEDRQAAGKGAALARAIIEEDARDAQSFVDRWRPRVESMSNARHRGMLRVILGEALEQKRSFDQALAGRTDMLGRRAEQAEPSVGVVLPTRWVE